MCSPEPVISSSPITLSAVLPYPRARGPQALFPIIPPMVQRLWVDGSGPKRNPCGAAADCSAELNHAWLDSCRPQPPGRSHRMVFRYRDVSKINPGPTALPAQDVPAPLVVTGMPTDRAASSVSGGFLNVPRPRDSLRYDAIERGIGGVQRTGEVGCVEDVSDPPAPKLQEQAR